MGNENLDFLFHVKGLGGYKYVVFTCMDSVSQIIVSFFEEGSWDGES